MKFRLAAVAAATLMASATSFAGVVTSSANIDFLAIDGQKATSSLLKEARSFTVNDTNTHQVVLRVSDIIRVGSDQEFFESDPIVLTFQGSAEDLKISAPSLNNIGSVNAFKANPKISITTASGAPVSAKQDYLKQEGILPNANLVENLSAYNSSGAPAAVAGFATAAVATTAALPAAGAAVANAPVAANNAKVQKNQVTVQGENASEQMLQYWYQQADKETQQRFLNWVKKQK